jgi:excisionase family DNA binding protein
MGLSSAATPIDSHRTIGRLLPPKDVARCLGVSVSMIYKLLRTAALPAIYIGRLPRVAETDLDAFVERQREAGR